MLMAEGRWQDLAHLVLFFVCFSKQFYNYYHFLILTVWI